MKKIIVFLCLCVCLATSAMAAEPTCNGGSIVTANNGTTFCKSDKGMNWWSAFTWCESQGRKLADFATMCPGVSQIAEGAAGQCSNLQNVGSFCVWSSLASGKGYAFSVCSDGAVYDNNRTVSNYVNALCE